MKVPHAERTFSVGGISTESTNTNSGIHLKKARDIISHIMCTKDRARMHKEMAVTNKGAHRAKGANDTLLNVQRFHPFVHPLCYAKMLL